MEKYSHIIGATGGRFRSAGFAAAMKPSPCASYPELLKHRRYPNTYYLWYDKYRYENKKPEISECYAASFD